MGPYRPDLRIIKLARILKELDEDQKILDTYDKHAAEDLRWCRIYLSKAMAAINTGSKDAPQS